MASEYPPMASELATDRLSLRLWEEADTAWHRSLVAERGDGKPSEEADCEVIRNLRRAWEESGISLLVIIRKLEGDVIGYCGLIVGRGSLDEPELAYELFRHVHGTGYATEAARAVLKAAVATGRSRLWATVRPWNSASFRVLEKLGFRRSHSTQDERGELVWNQRELP